MARPLDRRLLRTCRRRHRRPSGPPPAPGAAALPGGTPGHLHRFLNGVDKLGFWHKAVPNYAPDWLTRFHYDDADEGETEWYASSTACRRSVWMANYGAGELNPWTSRVEAPHEPTGALVDIDPGTETTFAEVRQFARLYYTALDHLGLLGGPKGDGAERPAIVDPGPAELQLRRHPSLGRAALPGRRGDAARDGELGVAEGRPAGPGSTTPRTGQQDPGRPGTPPGRRRARRCRCPSPGTNSATGRCGPTAGRRTVGKRLAEVGDPLRDLVGMQQSLPDL
jgi:hypothetical protein